MNPQSPAIKAERRAWNYWFEDGVPTLVGGFGCALFGLSFIFDRSLFRLVLVALYSVILLRNRPIIEWLKVRLTYPRTGYVTPPDSSQDRLPPVPGLEAVSLQVDPERLAALSRREHAAKKRMILVLALLLPAVLGTMFVDLPWMYALVGAALTVALGIMNGKEFKLSWIAISGVAAIGLGFAILPLGELTPALRVGYFSLACGLLFVANGTLALVRHLWRNPVASMHAE